MIKKIMKGVVFAPLFGFVGWFAISYIEVVCKNLEEIPLSSWNFFSVFM